MSEQKQEVLSHELLAAIGDYGYAKYRHDNDIITLGAWEDLITAIKVWNRSALAAKDARIAELEQKIIGLEDAFASNLDYRAMYRQLRDELTATHSEDGREVPEVVGYLYRTPTGPYISRADYKGHPRDELMTAAQHERIVAAKDAEIARLDAGWHEANKKVLEISLAQPARQVGDDDPIRDDDLVLVPRGLLGAARYAIKNKVDAPNVHGQLGEYCYGQAALAPAAVFDRDEWRCFYCDEHFTDKEQAALHFGTSLMHNPACQIDIAEYRAMEARMERYNEEDSDLHRAMYRMRTEHHQALRREEEKGYARGLNDAALAPAAAAVLPDKKSAGEFYGLDERAEIRGFNAALDEVARLNRLAIPEGLLRKLAHCTEPDCCIAYERGELRALLGKSGK